MKIIGEEETNKMAYEIYFSIGELHCMRNEKVFVRNPMTYEATETAVAEEMGLSLSGLNEMMDQKNPKDLGYISKTIELMKENIESVANTYDSVDEWYAD